MVIASSSTLAFATFEKIGIRTRTLAGSCVVVLYEAAKFTLCYGPMRLLALLRQGRLLSSFHRLGHPRGCRVSLHGQTTNSRGRTFTG